MSWDGIKMEEERMWREKKSANNATKVNHDVGLCMKFDCQNRDKKCATCFAFSGFVETESK